jgi:hypothetical protein
VLLGDRKRADCNGLARSMRRRRGVRLYTCASLELSKLAKVKSRVNHGGNTRAAVVVACRKVVGAFKICKAVRASVALASFVGRCACEVTWWWGG